MKPLKPLKPLKPFKPFNPLTPLAHCHPEPVEGGTLFPLLLRLHQLLQHKIGDRAKGRILECQGLTFEYHILIGRAVFVDGTVVVVSQERAGTGIGHIIPVLIHFEIGFDKIAFPHLQEFAEPFNIRGFEPGGEILTTIGTLQTVYFAERFLMIIG